MNKRTVRKDRLSTFDIGTLLGGSILVTIWTLFRFATKSTIFDLVGQQLLARQWLAGNLEGSVAAPTNYILKMLTVYMPGDLLGIDPKSFLVASTILINIATFVGLYFVLRLILQHFSVKSGIFFNISMLWLATVAGSVFWIQFTNSRNLELVAGLALLYLGLLIYQKATLVRCTLFALLAGLTYFADPMQLMVTSVALITFVILDSFFFHKNKMSSKRAGLIAILVAAGYILSLLLVYVVKSITNIDFFGVSSLSQSLAIFHNIPTVLIETGKNIVRLVAGTSEMGVWRQSISVLLAVLLGIVAIISFVKGKSYVKYRSLALFIGITLTVPIGVYIASGYPVLQTDTSRYLIMFAPALILLFSVIDIKMISNRLRHSVSIVAITIVVISTIFLVAATVGEMQKGLLPSGAIEQRYRYLQQNGYQYGYASMDTAIPAMYLLGKSENQVLLPLSCDKARLRKVTLFFEKGVFSKTEKQSTEVPIILDGNSINNHPNQCSQSLIEEQFGKPNRVDYSKGNTILIYDGERLLKSLPGNKRN